MSLNLREENFVVIDIGSYISKGGVGTHDTNKPPTAVNIIYFYNYSIYFLLSYYYANTHFFLCYSIVC